MEQRISLITLGVADVQRARAFYQRLGWEGQEIEETVFIRAGGIALVLWGRDKLALDCGVTDDQATGFSGIVLAHNVRSKAEVDDEIATAEGAGATVTGDRPRRSMAATPASSPISTATCGKLRTIRASHWQTMARSASPSSARRSSTGRPPGVAADGIVVGHHARGQLLAEVLPEVDGADRPVGRQVAFGAVRATDAPR